MIIEFTSTLIEKKDPELRGNNFEIQPFILQVEDKKLYLEAVGMYSGIANGINEGDVVFCKAAISSNPRKDNPDKYWTNINLIEMTNKLQTDALTEDQNKEDNLPF